MNNKRILYIGSLDETSNSFRRFRSLQQMGFDVCGIDINKDIYQGIFKSFHHHFNIGPGIKSNNKKVIENAGIHQPFLVWVDNKSFLLKKTFKKLKELLPGIKIINVITDDPTGKLKYAWRLCLQNASLFDIMFVQRSVNILELKKYGAKSVELCYRSFDPDFHKPWKFSENEKAKYACNVGFIGTYEAEREQYIAFLIENGIEVSVTGDGWPGKRYWKIIKPFYRGPSVYGEEYVKTISGMRIALHFLRKHNRDEQDSRSFEIPACYTFMLAEYSETHATLFKQNEDAVFFNTPVQLLDHIHYYLNNNIERERIAHNGYIRVYKSGYTHHDRLRDIVSKVKKV